MKSSKKWELLPSVKSGLIELSQNDPKNEEIKNLIATADSLSSFHEKLTKQNEELKLTMLISSRERNVYLEKLRKIEEYCEEKNWEDSSSLLKTLYEILYNDNN